MTNNSHSENARVWPHEDGITVLRAVAPVNPRTGRHPYMAKQFRRQGDDWVQSAAYENATHYNAQEYPVRTTVEMFDLIKLASKYNDACIIRGALLGEKISAQNIIRRLHDRQNEPATFITVKRRWLALDFDGIELPDGVDPTDPTPVCNAALKMIPESFRNASYVWQLTSSAGIKAGGRLRLYFLLEYGLDEIGLKSIFAECPVDKSIFRANQPIYIAAPIFHGGDDFIPVRIGVHHGDHERVDIQAPPPKTYFERVTTERGYSNVGFEGYVDQIGDLPFYPNGNGFHAPIKSAVASYIAINGPDIDPDELANILEPIIRDRGAECGRTQKYIDDRVRDLRPLIRNISALERKSRELVFLPPLIDDPVNARAEYSSLSDAESSVKGAIDHFFASAAPIVVQRQRHTAKDSGVEDLTAVGFWDIPPEEFSTLVPAQTAIGKTEMVSMSMLTFINGEYEGAAEHEKALYPRRIEYIVPSHSLATDIERRMNAKRAGLASVWRGMEQPHPSGKGTMCVRFSEMNEWLEAGGDAGSMCKACPFGPKKDKSCAYLNQKCDTPVLITAAPQAVTAGVTPAFMRTVRLAGGNEIKAGPDLIVVDETKPQSWLEGTDQKRPVVVNSDDLKVGSRPPKIEGVKTSNNSEAVHKAADDILHILNRILDTANGARITVGQVRLLAIDAFGLRQLKFKLASTLIDIPEEWLQLRMKERTKRLNLAGGWNKRRRRAIQLLDVLIGLFESDPFGVAVASDQTLIPHILIRTGDDGKKGVQIIWRRSIAKERKGIPTLFLDATAKPAILRQWYSHLDVAAVKRVNPPEGAVYIIQIHDSIVGYGGLTKHDDEDVKLATTSKNNTRKIINAIDCFSCGEKAVAFIGPKTLTEENEKHWAARCGGRPKGALTGHYNAIAGLDHMKDADVLIVLSRPAPSPTTVELIAEAIFSKIPTATEQWYIRGAGYYKMRDGLYRIAPQSESHPDPLVEVVRQQIVDAELEQSIGRGRLIRRAADRPLTVIIATAQPTGLPIDRLVTRKQFFAARDIEALSARGITVPIGSSNKGYADVLASALGDTVDAVKKKAATLNVPNAYISTLIGVPHVEDRNTVEFLIRVRQRARYHTNIRLSRELAERPKFSMRREGIQPIDMIQVSPMRMPSLGPISGLPEYAREPIERFASINWACTEFYRIHTDPCLVTDLSDTIRHWLTDLIDFGWTSRDLFDDFTEMPPSGLIYLLRGRKIVDLDDTRVVLNDGSLIERTLSDR